jgi:hypothetical protein
MNQEQKLEVALCGNIIRIGDKDTFISPIPQVDASPRQASRTVQR